MKRSYDSIAPVYDRIARLIYGNALLKTQAYLIQAIPPRATILIIGGGSGWILEEIARNAGSGHSITYIDSSAKMIALAQKRNIGKNEVTFVTATIQHANLKKEYDVVITPFLLDNFTNETLQLIFGQIDAALSPKALWLYCDFRNTNVWWQKMMLRTMYIFFRTFCGIEATRLPDADGFFAKHGYEVMKEQAFLKAFLTARIYEKT